MGAFERYDCRKTWRVLAPTIASHSAFFAIHLCFYLRYLFYIVLNDCCVRRGIRGERDEAIH